MIIFSRKSNRPFSYLETDASLQYKGRLKNGGVTEFTKDKAYE